MTGLKPAAGGGGSGLGGGISSFTAVRHDGQRHDQGHKQHQHDVDQRASY